jgi:hypothetical protein
MIESKCCCHASQCMVRIVKYILYNSYKIGFYVVLYSACYLLISLASDTQLQEDEGD